MSNEQDQRERKVDKMVFDGALVSKGPTDGDDTDSKIRTILNEK